jgi:RimJ/RimL family protein N-acetyltransferase
MASTPPREAVTRDGRPYVIRTAEVEDADAIVALERAVVAEGRWTITAAEDPEETRERRVRWICWHRDEPGALAVVAVASGGPIGVADLKPGARRRIAHRVSLGVTVDAAWREVGVGRTLTETLLGWAAAQPGIEKICLGVLGTNVRAIALYRSLGFVEEGRQPRAFRMEDGAFVDNR